jgi:hypothetical protein
MSEAALRAAVPPHFAKDSPCAPIFGELCGIRRKLEEMSAAKKTHTVCVPASVRCVRCGACVCCAAWALLRSRRACVRACLCVRPRRRAWRARAAAAAENDANARPWAALRARARLPGVLRRAPVGDREDLTHYRQARDAAATQQRTRALS